MSPLPLTPPATRFPAATRPARAVPLLPALPRPRGWGAFALAALFTLSLQGCGEAGDAAPPAGAGSEARTASLAAPPDLRVGDWWEVEMVPTLTGATYPTTLVVTHRGDGRAVIGVPPDHFSHDFLVLHVPPLGDLDLESFAWRVMWDDFEALRFPLEEGRSWTADFHGVDVEAEVTRVEGNRAWVTLLGEGERIELVYDADVGMITEFREDRLGLAFQVTDHGTGYEGDVLALSGIRLGLMETPASAVAHHGDHEEGAEGDGGSGEEAGAGTRSSTRVEVDTSGSHGSLSLILWNVGQEATRGEYGITAIAPDGTPFEARFQGTEPGASIGVQSFGHDAVNGPWSIEFHRDGPGGLLVELFTYDLERVELGGG